jgi:hypothetical protein
MEGLYPIVRRKRRPLRKAEVGVRNAEVGSQVETQMPDAGGQVPVVPVVLEAKPERRRKGARCDAAS